MVRAVYPPYRPKSDVVCRKLTHLPAWLFVDQISTFSGSGLSEDDILVVASKCYFLATWDTETGVPLRVLQSSASFVRRLFTSDVIMEIVSLLYDNNDKCEIMKTLTYLSFIPTTSFHATSKKKPYQLKETDPSLSATAQQKQRLSPSGMERHRCYRANLPP